MPIELIIIDGYGVNANKVVIFCYYGVVIIHFTIIPLVSCLLFSFREVRARWQTTYTKLSCSLTENNVTNVELDQGPV